MINNAQEPLSFGLDYAAANWCLPWLIPDRSELALAVQTTWSIDEVPSLNDLSPSVWFVALLSYRSPAVFCRLFIDVSPSSATCQGQSTSGIATGNGNVHRPTHASIELHRALCMANGWSSQSSSIFGVFVCCVLFSGNTGSGMHCTDMVGAWYIGGLLKMAICGLVRR